MFSNKPLKNPEIIVDQYTSNAKDVTQLHEKQNPLSLNLPPLASDQGGYCHSSTSPSIYPLEERSPARERRGSRARRRFSSLPPQKAAASGVYQDVEDADLPVIDTTSAEVERTADGSVSKVNEYIILRDLGQGSSAQVKLCRLIPNRSQRGLAGAKEEGLARDCPGVPEFGADTDDEDDQYAVKIFDRTELMKRGHKFARPRLRGSDGRLVTSVPLPEGFVKVQREIAIMKKLVHPNVVQLVEVIDAPLDSSLYMVMEYVERGAVMSCVNSEQGLYASPQTGGCLDAATAARYFADVLAGLEYLHVNSISHRDLKPENVLIGEDNMAKIADFGVSQHFMDDETRAPMTARSLARSNSRAQISNTEGTWCFWAPEMCGRVSAGNAAFNAYAADAWAAGITLWCFLYGTVPFFRLDPTELFDAIAEENAPVPKGTDKKLKDLLEHILDKDAGQRLVVSEARRHCWVRVNAPRLLLPEVDAFCPTTATTANLATVTAPEPIAVLGRSSAGGAGRIRKDASAGGDGIASAGIKGIVSVTDEDLRSAVTEAPNFVLVTKIRNRVHGKLQSMRLSNERGAQEAATGAAAAALLVGKTGSDRPTERKRTSLVEYSIPRPHPHRPRTSSFACVAS